MMARRKISLGELAEKIDITPANLSILKTGKAKAVRFSTLEAICKVLDCQPGDILEYVEEKKSKPMVYVWTEEQRTHTLMTILYNNVFFCSSVRNSNSPLNY